MHVFKEPVRTHFSLCALIVIVLDSTHKVFLCTIEVNYGVDKKDNGKLDFSTLC